MDQNVGVYDLEPAWISHSSAHWRTPATAIATQVLDIEGIKRRIATVLPNDFTWEYLQKVGVSGIAFPWRVVEHYGNTQEMLARVDMDPDSQSMNWDAHSWAPLLDAATSVGSTIFFNDPRMRIVSQIDKVLLLSDGPPPKIGYLYIQEATDDRNAASHVSMLTEQGEVIAMFHSMRFSDVDGASRIGGSVETLAHQIAWIPPKFAERPTQFSHVVLVSDDTSLLEQYATQLRAQVPDVVSACYAEELTRPGTLEILKKKGCAVVYLPGRVDALQEVSEAANRFVWETVCLIKQLVSSGAAAKLFVITSTVYKGESTTALAHGTLCGLARIAAQEHPDIWGALIDNDTPLLPFIAVKYVRDAGIIRMEDGVPRVGRIRPLTREQRHAAGSPKTLLSKPEGTYVVTGGFGHLGLEVLTFLVEKGAHRIVVVSRRALPLRSQWDAASGSVGAVVAKIKELEKLGASIYALSLDIGAMRTTNSRLRWSVSHCLPCSVSSMPPV